jgi:ribosomal protein S18 acetylase RimI-like enzyme
VIGESPVADSAFRERIALLRARGGRRAAAYWLLRRLGRLDVYTLYAIALQESRQGSSPAQKNHESCELIRLQDVCDLDCHAPRLLEAIDPHCGCGIAATIRRGGCVFALVRAGEVLSQLKIERAGGEVDTPAELRIGVGPESAFLSFLYTSEAARGLGWAKTLVAAVCATLAAEGLRYCVCHVQATNLRSANTFESLAWKPAAWLLCSAGGRLLGIVRNPLARFSGLEVQAHPDAPGDRSATPES